MRHVAIRTPAPIGADYRTVFLTLPGLLWFYLRLCAWPVGLTLVYERQYLHGFTRQGVALPLLGLALLGLLLVLFYRRQGKPREALFAGLFVLIAMAPALNVRVLPADDFVHVRYLYLSLAGVSILAALAIGAIRRTSLQIATIVLLATALLTLCVIQQGYWASDLLLWFHCSRTAPDSKIVLNNLASSLAERGEYASAISLYKKALAANPEYPEANRNLGYTYYRLGMLTKAEQYLESAVRLSPYNPRAKIFLGMTYYKRGDLDHAERELRKAIGTDPGAEGAHLALSLVLESRGDTAGAIRETKAELEYYPGEEEARKRLEGLK
jgi:tetratricopeptide (TPR) repeat protein